MTADLSALIARLEAAEVGSRELGHDVLLALGWHREQIGNFYGPLYQWSSPDFSPHLISGDEDKLPNPVLSLDAALALAERLGCGRTYVLDNAIQTTVRALPTAHLWNDHGKHTGHARTMPLALVIAILRAKQGDHP